MSDNDGWLADQARQRRVERVEKARGPFDAVRRFMSIGGLWDSTAFKRADKAVTAVAEWRNANGQSRQPDAELALAVRVVGDTFADQILAAGQGRYDEVTLRWVAAGLRCPRRAFCAGCDQCQTVTSPQRGALVHLAGPGGADPKETRE